MILFFGGPAQENVTGARDLETGDRETPSTYNLQPTTSRSRLALLLVENGGGRK